MPLISEILEKFIHLRWANFNTDLDKCFSCEQGPTVRHMIGQNANPEEYITFSMCRKHATMRFKDFIDVERDMLDVLKVMDT